MGKSKEPKRILSGLLGPTAEQRAILELKAEMARQLKKRRQKENMTQAHLAGLLNSSQSRVAKMEASDPSVSLDLMVKALLTVGVSRKKLTKVVGSWAGPKEPSGL